MSATPPSVVTNSFVKANSKCMSNFVEGVFVVFVNILTGIFGIVFNSLVGATVANTRNLRTNFSFLICGLSISDLLLSLVVKPMLVSIMVPAIGHDCSSSSYALYYTTAVFSLALNAASMGTLIFISVDRCLCVVFPIKYPTIVTPGRIKFVIGLTWLGACLCIVSAFILYPAIMKSEAMRIFILTGLCFSYLVIFLCYSMIYIKIRKQSAVRTELHGSRDKKPTFREGFP